MKYPLVSVIIPTYNRAEILLVSIKSVLNQTYSNFELLIIDDGSTDNTKCLVNKIKDKRVKYYQKENGGVASTRNVGLKKAKGYYIAFLDDDDIFLSNKIKLQVNYLNKNKQFGFCHTNMYFRTGSGLYLRHETRPKNSYLNLLLNYNFIVTSTVMIRHSVLRISNTFISKYEPVEDYAFWLDMAKRVKFGFVHKPLAIGNKHTTNISNNMFKLSYNDGRVRLRNLKNYDGNLPRKYKSVFKWELNFQQGKVYLLESKKGVSRKYFIQAIKLKPKIIKQYLLLIQSCLPFNIIINVLFPLLTRFEMKKYKKVKQGTPQTQA